MSRQEGLYYEGIDSLSEFPSIQNADLQLQQKNGWVIVKIEKLTNDLVTEQGIDRSERLVYILGHKHVVGSNPTSSQSSTPASPTSSQQPPKAQPSKPKMAGMSSPCRYCQGPIIWSKRDGRNIPLNPDGSDHRCR